MRRKYVYDPDLKEMVEVTVNYKQERVAPDIHFDIPEYVSPVTGKVISSRSARREDLKRTGCRPYEGREQETKIANEWRKEQERKADQRMERHVVDVWQHSPERIRRQFK
jgi:hypothetical protein